MQSLPTENNTPEWYAEDFVKQLQLDGEVGQRCEWSCLLWSRDHWAREAQRSQVALQQAKERAAGRQDDEENIESLLSDARFLNTVAQVYGKLFGTTESSCSVKVFANCPFMGERQRLLKKGALATVFVTILHKGVSYAMLDRHPLDSGLIREEYHDVYGVDLTDFQDLDNSLKDGRFAKLYENVLKRARELAGIPKPIADNEH